MTRKRVRKSWAFQIFAIEKKGRAAFHAGAAESDNPYEGGYRNQNGPGGQIQKQRRAAWARGFNLEKAEKEGGGSDAGL